MSGSLHPALILMAGALVLPLLRGPWRGAATVVLPLAGFLNLLGLEAGPSCAWSWPASSCTCCASTGSA